MSHQFILPAEPKPEWFFCLPSTLTDYSPHFNLGSYIPNTKNEEPKIMNSDISAPNNFYQKMTATTYTLYLNAHTAWRGQVAAIRLLEHQHALTKRQLSKCTEKVVGFVHSAGVTKPFPPRQVFKDGSQTVVVDSAVKVVHSPTLSMKPHAGEKRKAKKALADAKRKAQSEMLSARSVLVPKTLKTQVEVVTKVADLKAREPLFKQELVAAKSAASRAKAIHQGAPDLVANVNPEAGWKIVTRKKGAFLPVVSKVDAGTTEEGENSWTVASDPGTNRRMVPMNAVKSQPTTVTN